MLFVWCIFLIIVSSIIGWATYLFWRSIGFQCDAEEYLYLAPGLGGLVFGVFAYYPLLIFNKLHPIVFLIFLGFFVAGVLTIAKTLRDIEFARLLEYLCSVVALLLLAGFPFKNHLAPPDVDALYFGQLSYLIKQGLGLPYSAFWPGFDSIQYFSATAANANLVAIFSLVSGIDIALSSLYMSVFWVTAILLVALLFIKKLAKPLSIPLQWLCIFFVFNSAFVWSYGDGSYNRVPALCAQFIIVYLIGKGMDAKRIPALMIGFLFTTILYFHYRFFLWTSLVLFVWGLFYWWQCKRWQALKDVFAIAVVTLIMALPLFVSHFQVLDFILAGHKGDVLFEQRHALKADFLIKYFMRFQGVVLHPLAFIGVLFFLKRYNYFKDNGLLTISLIFYGVMIFLCIDPLVLFFFPFTYNILYANTAMLSSFSIPKLSFGICAILWFNEIIKNITNKIRIIIIGITSITLLYLFYKISNIILSFNYYKNAFRNLFVYFPYIQGTELIYSAILFVISFILILKSIRNRKEISFTPLILGALLTIIASYEMSNARFNYSYITEYSKDVYLWAKENIPRENSLILSASVGDLPSEIEYKNAQNTFAGKSRPRMYDLLWLPIVSERATVFNNINRMNRLSKIFCDVSGNKPDFQELDWAFWNIETQRSRDIMINNHITHVYFNARLHNMLQEKIKKVDWLRKSYESFPMELFGVGAAIYEVI